MICAGFAGGASSSGNFAGGGQRTLPTRPARRSAGSSCGSIAKGVVGRSASRSPTTRLAHLSPDEQSVPCSVSRPAHDIWVPSSRATCRAHHDGAPGARIRSGIPTVSMSSSGPGPERRAFTGAKTDALFAGGEKAMALSWSGDRQYVIVSSPVANRGTDLIAVTTTTPSREIAVAQSQYDGPRAVLPMAMGAFVSNESVARSVRAGVPRWRRQDAISTAERDAGALVHRRPRDLLRRGRRHDDGGLDRDDERPPGLHRRLSLFATHLATAQRCSQQAA